MDNAGYVLAGAVVSLFGLLLTITGVAWRTSSLLGSIQRAIEDHGRELQNLRTRQDAADSECHEHSDQIATLRRAVDNHDRGFTRLERQAQESEKRVLEAIKNAWQNCPLVKGGHEKT